MTRYHLRLTNSAALFPRMRQAPLTVEALASQLPGVVVSSLTPLVDGYEVAVDLERRDHPQAMEELATALHQLGLDVLQATITEFATAWAEGGVLGAVSGAAAGAATKSGEGFIALFLGGLILGAIAGATRETVRGRFSARPAIGGWEIARLDPLPPPPGAEPAF